MHRIIGILLVSLFVLSACRSGGQKDDFSQRPVKVFRYDRLQYEATVLNSVAAQQKMNIECPRATKLLIEDVLGIGAVDDPDINDRLNAYYSDSILVRLMDDVIEKFKDLTGIEEELTKGFENLKKEIPSVPVPRIYSQISALNQSVVVGDSLLGFSLDKYMGQDYPLYKKYYYSFQRRWMVPERIVPDCFTFYLLSQFPFQWREGHRTLFDFMVYRGKIGWVVEHILQSDYSGRLTLGYTREELNWCRKHEEALWKELSRKRYLERTDPMLIRSYTYAEQVLSFKGDKMPPCIGIWLGMQLVDKYMKSNQRLTAKDLLEKTDFSDLLPLVKH
ncbi:gliding motility lipoprotein GldB [uncultured Phocaeicola sp.]|jgi:hypothetical protein|uniref:gliding motility protein GldB-related protein n=1 Tax=uncultured Phocaeicola sp. TaxID=990718 RepID=UPI0025E4746F|nr:gliding motility lipoprotein GldB [uncultured Phocaeicola sp.]